MMNVKQYFYKTLRTTLLMMFLLVMIAGTLGATIILYFLPQMPSTETLKDVRLQIPLRVYTQDNIFVGEFGEQRRIPVATNQTPPLMIKAILAAEDDRFYEHPGVDIKSLMRAVFNLLKVGEIQQGASTITMQITRNFFLTRERTFSRKFKEILLALKIERELSKDEIMELYLNKVFLGNRAYGFGAAAQVYYGRNLDQLTLAEWAMLAGLPKAPSANNPLSNAETAIDRRNYVLERMVKLGYIDSGQYEAAISLPSTATLHRSTPEIEAPYLAEMVRAYMQEHYGEEEAYTGGFKVITTVDSQLQRVAQVALRHALWTYDERHGYRGVFTHEKKLPKDLTDEKKDEILKKYPTQGGLIPSLVLQVKEKAVVAFNTVSGEFEIEWDDLSWANRCYRSQHATKCRYPKSAWDITKRGDIILVRKVKPKAEAEPPKRITTKSAKLVATKASIDVTTPPVEEKPAPPKKRWRLAQIPVVEGAIVSLRPNDGATIALAGGFNFYQSKFNRVVQAERQPGSSFKPFIYSAALENHFSPGSILIDAPMVFKVGNKVWRPHNYSGTFYGATTLKDALTFSRNLASIYLLRKVGIDRAIDHAIRFGFQRDKIPRNLTIALGTCVVTPLELATGYATFANGGYKIEPYFVRRIENMEGKEIYVANPLQVCYHCAPPTNKPVINKGKPMEAGGLIATANASTLQPTVLTSTDSSQPATVDNASFRMAPQIISPRNALTMTDILKEVVRRGTAKAMNKQLKRDDIAGKTGTTNNERDAWFSGYTPDILTTTWVGFDKPRSLGHGETGGRAALPMWIEFMKYALKDKPVKILEASGNFKILSVPTSKGAKEREVVEETYVPRGKNIVASKNRLTEFRDMPKPFRDVPKSLKLNKKVPNKNGNPARKLYASNNSSSFASNRSNKKEKVEEKESKNAPTVSKSKSAGSTAHKNPPNKRRLGAFAPTNEEQLF
ncbi:MAG: hypothetical protein BWK79_02525 [Beggiatoa sp. IS2]|nr:MAG: hypothetical protein BWK79_02525 [Beggiatoa sp. IS2]